MPWSSHGWHASCSWGFVGGDADPPDSGALLDLPKMTSTGPFASVPLPPGTATTLSCPSGWFERCPPPGATASSQLAQGRKGGAAEVTSPAYRSNAPRLPKQPRSAFRAEHPANHSGNCSHAEPRHPFTAFVHVKRPGVPSVRFRETAATPVLVAASPPSLRGSSVPKERGGRPEATTGGRRSPGSPAPAPRCRGGAWGQDANRRPGRRIAPRSGARASSIDR